MITQEEEKNFIADSKELIDFIAKSPSPFHAVDNIASELIRNGYKELCLKKKWDIQPGQCYFVRRNGTALIAFHVNTNVAEDGLRIVAAHSDAPTFRIKPQPEMVTDGKLLTLNTETYGGAILHTWMDRPLSVAGRVVLKTSNAMHPKKVLFDLERPLGVIPSQAIHFNRGINEQMSLNKQTDMPLFVQTLDNGTASSITLKNLIANKLNIQPNDILDYDLNLYDVEHGTILGTDNSIILCPKLDDLAMAYAATRAMINSNNANTNRVVCIFDNEEVGSGTKQGAQSPLLKNVLERIAEHLGLCNEERQMMTYNSFFISADQAHALHPNKPAAHDPNLHPTLNGGPVIKINANQKYMTDADSSAIFQQLCQEADVPFQMFVNRSDMAGGSTLGNLLTSQIDIHGVDIGNPMLGMHSARETGGVRDQTYVQKVFTHFLSK